MRPTHAAFDPSRMSRRVLGRRGVLSGAAMLSGVAAVMGRPALAALPVPSGDVLAFRLVRHSDAIGTHRVTFERDGGILTVRTAIDVLVTLLSIPVARYTHRSTETWQGTTLIGLSGETHKNGENEWINARRTDEGLVVLGSQTARYVAPEAAKPTSYWNRQTLGGQMISMEDGVLLDMKLAEHRADRVRLASGSEIPANHYSLTGPFAVDLWYDTSETWAGMAMTVIDGSKVLYERL
jgi:Family of unknown function (DUF6134)